MKTTALIVVAGIAAAASAQGTMSLDWSVSDDGNGDGVLTPGETGIATLWASMDPTPHGFAGTISDFSHDGSGAYFYDNLLDALTDDGTDDGAGTVTNIEHFQLNELFNGDYDNSNPIAIAMFSITPDSYAPHTISFGTFNHLNFDVYVDEFGTSVGYDGQVGGGRFQVIPTPATAALLGLGGLVAGRRRR